ncbi:hypothetical protein Hanom_Chr03g00247771 [Helianthus anomalus]
MSVVCEPHLQASAREDVAQISAVCKEKRVCFFFLQKQLQPHNTHKLSLSLSALSLSFSLSLQTLSLYNHHHRLSLPLSLRPLSLTEHTHTLSLYNHHRTTTAPPPPSHRSLTGLSLYDGFDGDGFGGGGF